jgi:hypothetical membrane protein
MKNKKIDLYLAISGILVPIFYLGLVIILGLLEPGYSHMTKMMSILGGVGGIRGLAFNIGVSIVGILIIAFSIELHRSINKGRGSKIGPGLIILGGVGLIGSCIFHCDLGCANFIVERNFIGTMHALTAFIGGLGLGISPFFIFARLRKDPQWKNYKWFTLIMGILSNIPAVVLWVTVFTIGAPKEIGGMIQRLSLIFPLIWIGMMSYRMLQLSVDNR